MEDNTPVPFGYKIGWLAISSTDRDAVVRSLELTDPREVTWKLGIDTVYRNAYGELGPGAMVFVSPPVQGWILSVSDWFMGTGGGDGVPEVERLIIRLSQEFGEAQAFATYRVVGYEHWMFARSGILVRSFVDSEDGLSESGEPTPVELDFSWYPLPLDDEETDQEEIDFDEERQGGGPNEESVMVVAGAWSINPQELGPNTSSQGPGILARAPQPLRVHRNVNRPPGRRPWWRFW